MTLSLQNGRRKVSESFFTMALAALVVLIGNWIVKAPMKAWLVVGSAFGLLLLEVAPVYWMTAAILAATVSRVLVAIGAPRFLNFLHYPLVLGGLIVALLTGTPSRLARSMGGGLLVFLILNFVSWMINSGELARPLLNALVLAEPFLLIYGLLAIPLNERTARRIWNLLLGIALLQVPLGVWQYMHGGRQVQDLMQGSFVAQSTGAHVAGGVVLLGVIIMICKASTAVRLRDKLLFFLIAAPLFAFSVLADAKQVIVCFIPGLIWAITSCTRVKPIALVLPVVFTAAISYAAFTLYQPLQMVGDTNLLSGGAEAKWAIFSVITSKLSSKPAGWLVGLGPGNSVSRVALLTPDYQLDGYSPVAQLGLKTAPATKDVLLAKKSNYLANDSSVWSPETSWFGIIGDLGLFGLVGYLWIAWRAWSGLSVQRNWQSASAKGGLIMAGLLGGVYVWLEEPGFTLPVAAVVALSLTSQNQRRSAT